MPTRTSLTNENGIKIDGPLLINPDLYRDSRGFFFESWNQIKFDELIKCPTIFVQDNQSKSSKGVLRGLHYQISPHSQGKLVRCISGEIFDVAVDLRQNSPTFSQSVVAYLSSENHKQLWIPIGFAHGFLTLSDSAEVAYKTTDYWDRDCERDINWKDASLGINWPEINCSPLLSEKDENAPMLDQIPIKDLF